MCVGLLIALLMAASCMVTMHEGERLSCQREREREKDRTIERKNARVTMQEKGVVS